MDINPFGMIYSYFERLYEKWEPFRNLVDNTWTSIKELAQSVKTEVLGEVNKMWATIKDVFADLKKELIAIGIPLDKLPVTWKRIKEGISGAYAETKKFLLIVKDGFFASFSAAWEVVKSFLSNTWTGFKDMVGGIFKGFGAIGRLIVKSLSIKNWTNGAMKEELQVVKNEFTRAGKGLFDFMPVTNIANRYKEYGETAADAFRKSYDYKDIKRIATTGKGRSFTPEHESKEGEHSKGGNGASIGKKNTSGSTDISLRPSTGGGSGARSITIENINITMNMEMKTESLQGADFDVVEDKLTESLYRVLRNLELSS